MPQAKYTFSSSLLHANSYYFIYLFIYFILQVTLEVQIENTKLYKNKHTKIQIEKFSI